MFIIIIITVIITTTVDYYKRGKTCLGVERWESENDQLKYLHYARNLHVTRNVTETYTDYNDNFSRLEIRK